MNPFPCLSSTGWCTDPELAMEAIMEAYCTCEYSATKLYKKYIRSLPYQLMRYTDASALASVVQEDLQVLYKNNFDNVECTVTYDPDNQQGIAEESPKFRLEISLIVIDGNRRYSLSKIITINNGVILTIGESLL